MKINSHEFYEGSFADEKIRNIEYQKDSKYLSFIVERAETEVNEKPVCYKNVKFTIKDWWEIKVYDTEKFSQNEIKVDFDEADFLDEVLIYTPSDRHLTLEGFGKKIHVMEEVCIY